MELLALAWNVPGATCLGTLFLPLFRKQLLFAELLLCAQCILGTVYIGDNFISTAKDLTLSC